MCDSRWRLAKKDMVRFGRQECSHCHCMLTVCIGRHALWQLACTVTHVTHCMAGGSRQALSSSNPHCISSWTFFKANSTVAKSISNFCRPSVIIEGEGNDRQVPIALLVLAGFQLVLRFFHLIPDSLSTSSADLPRFQAHYIKQRQQHLFILFMGFSRQEC